MRLIAAFLKMIRLPNLLFIALTQILFQVCIYESLYPDSVSGNAPLRFAFLILASVLIAAAGYIINDYFDINIDEVNKPERMVVDKIISRRWAILWHFVLSLAGIFFTILAMPLLSKWHLVAANVLCVALLWFYSTNFKKSLLTGNIVISLLTAWTILIVFFSKVDITDAFGNSEINQVKFFRLALLYAGFAFIISLIREAIKDMEDMHGDSRYGCKTMPLVWGLNGTKVYVAVWLVVLICLVLIIQVYILQFRWWIPVLYCIFTIILPLSLVLLRLRKSVTQKEFRQLSTIMKLVMLTGILSMVFFYFIL